MIDSFRKFFGSKIGLGVTLVFLALIAVAFASSDVANTGTFGGISGGDRVAVVGDSKIGTATLSRTASREVDQLRQDNPNLSLRAFVEQGGLTRALESLLDRSALAEFARIHGLRAGDNLINSEIVNVPAFRGVDGNFSEEAYRGALAQQGLTDAVVRGDLANSLLAQQLLVPASLGTRVSDGLTQQYAALLKERRQGGIASLPSGLFAPAGDPSEAQLRSFYDSNRSDFIRPERRVARFAAFGTEAIEAQAEPTEPEIAARYNKDKANYAASEERTITQIIVPTEQGARALRAEIAGGASIASVAAQAGFSPARIGPLTKAELQSQSSAAVANAVFATTDGGVAELARSGLGWHVARIDAVDRRAARTLAQVRGEVADQVRTEKRRRAIADLSANVEEELDSGTALAEIAQTLGATVQTSRPITADGRVYGVPGQTAPAVLGPALATLFQMQEGEPQLAEIVPGKQFLIYEVSQITESAPAPLAEIKPQVTARWRMSEGARRARAAADRVLGRVAKGQTLAAAVAAEEISLPAPDQVDLDRLELMQQTRGQVPAPLALFFSMAQGTTKKLEGPSSLGWFVVNVDKVLVKPLAAGDPLIASTRQQLSQAIGNEYVEQFIKAMRKEVGVETNPAAIEAVRKSLVGES